MMKKIAPILFILIVLIGFSSCNDTFSYNQEESVDSSDDNYNALSVERIEIELYEGHSHAPRNSQNAIGHVMWCNNFSPNNRNFHALPYNSEMRFPLKPYQKMVYNKDVGSGSLICDPSMGDTIFSVQSTTPRGKYRQGVMYAIVVKLFDADGKRIDQELKLQSANKTQVFYQVKNARGISEKYPFKEGIQDTSIAYFWYYDRLPNRQNGDDNGDYFVSNPVGFRGVIQCLEPYLRFDLQMMVSRTDEDKIPPYVNSISPTNAQKRGRILEITIPMRTVVPYPNFSTLADEKIGFDFYDERWTDDHWEIHDRFYKEIEAEWYQDIQTFWPHWTVEEIKQFYNEYRRMDVESGTFYL